MVQVKNTVGAVMQVLAINLGCQDRVLKACIRQVVNKVIPHSVCDENTDLSIKRKMPMVIGIPSKATFEKFVQVNKDGEDPTGSCIDVFNKARERLYYGLPHSFKPIDGKYDELIEMVYNKVITNNL
ncbi:hypothetical protein IFM89_002438 [Coptis chinensis]|uniref:Uncharacterized protein n=1 Tax=Coptis chinensis TaxID=261450 RepID=A0A835M3Y1_9MAGN|nr:hypothetical protein IFM89_002438 [Coptis chinensis]